MNLTNEKCPVCGKTFENGDDVVFCPECGTPHHRECYKRLGNCYNAPLHKTGFSFTPSAEPENKQEKDVEEKPQNSEAFSANSERADNTENTEKNTFGAFPVFGGENNPLNEAFSRAEKQNREQVLIDGKPSACFEAAIGKNQQYYIPRFIIMEKMKKNVVMNIGAFLFPVAWSFYRKMYKLGFLVLALFIAISFSSNAFLFFNSEWINSAMTCAEENPAFYTDIVIYQNGGDVSLTPSESHFIEVTNEAYKNYPAVLYYAFWALEAAIRVVMALFATKLYKEKLSKNIDNAFRFGMDNASVMTFLDRKYGVMPFFAAVIIAIIESSISGLL